MPDLKCHVSQSVYRLASICRRSHGPDSKLCPSPPPLFKPNPRSVVAVGLSLTLHISAAQSFLWTVGGLLAALYLLVGAWLVTAATGGFK